MCLREVVVNPWTCDCYQCLCSLALSLPSSTAIMAVVDPTIPDWIPTVDVKCDGKQLTFSVPAALLPITRQILYRRYVGDIGKRDGYHVIWVDQTKSNKDLEVSDSDQNDLNNISSTPRSVLFKSRTQVSVGATKVVIGVQPPACYRCPPSPGSSPPAKLSPSTKTRPGTAPAATGRNQAAPCSQTFAVGTCAARFCPSCTSLAGLLELPSVAENSSTAAA